MKGLSSDVGGRSSTTRQPKHNPGRVVESPNLPLSTGRGSFRVAPAVRTGRVHPLHRGGMPQRCPQGRRAASSRHSASPQRTWNGRGRRPAASHERVVDCIVGSGRLPNPPEHLPTAGCRSGQTLHVRQAEPVSWLPESGWLPGGASPPTDARTSGRDIPASRANNSFAPRHRSLASLTAVTRLEGEGDRGKVKCDRMRKSTAGASTFGSGRASVRPSRSSNGRINGRWP